MTTETTGGAAATTTAGDTSVDTTTTGASTTTAEAAGSNSTTATDAGAGQDQGDAGKTTEGDGADGEKKEGDEPQGAPEAYADFTLPEGYVLEGERMELATSTFKELNLTQAQSQKLVDLFVKADGENGSVLKQMIDGERADTITQWGEDSKKEFGPTYDKIVDDARAGVEWAKQERPGLLDTFNKEGWGNHPDALWAFAKLGELSRGSSLRGMGGDTVNAGDQSIARRMYPEMK